MKQSKCPNCGASLHYNENDDVCICEFCKSVFINEHKKHPIEQEELAKKEHEENLKKQEKNSIENNEDKPKINYPLLIILFIFVPFVAVLYLILISFNISKWEKEHGSDDNSKLE